MKVVIDVNFDPWDVYRTLAPELKIHCENVARYTRSLYELSMIEGLFDGQLSKQQLKYVESAVKFHDIGKSVYKDSLLNKEGPLNMEERRMIQCHVEIGMMIVENSNKDYRHNKSEEALVLMELVRVAVAQHHERYDGTGYPMRLKGNEISPLGQMCGICDVFDAMTSDRSYHKAMSRDKVIAHLINEKGKHFNPELVDLFVKNQAYFVKCGSHSEIRTTA